MVVPYLRTSGGGPAFNHYFSTESGGLYDVNFQFIKKSDGTRYQTIHQFSYFSNVFSGLQGIINEVAQNMYADNARVFDNVRHISFTFEGLSKSEFYDGHAAGFTPGIYTLYGSSGQVLWNGPITCQLGCKDIPHEFMHSIGATVGRPNGFYGLPDRGYDPNVYDPDLNNPGHTGNSFHGNMQFDYDIMEHNVALLPQHSLYGLRPIASHDLIFLGWIKPDEIDTISQSNFTGQSDIKLADVNYPLTAQQKADGYYRVVKVMAHQNYDGRGFDDYYLVEYHNASEFDKAFENYDEYQTGGYNTGVLIWHVKEIVDMVNDTYPQKDNLVELQPAVPYNSWYGIESTIPPDNYPSHGNFYRPPLPDTGQSWWNGVYSGDFNYLDDNRFWTSPSNESRVIFFPDGGTHIWERTIVNQPGWVNSTSSWKEPGTVALPREWSMKSDFFSDSNVKGHVTNSMTDGTRPSTKEWGYYNSQTGQPVSAQTHIAITNITRHSGYMTTRVYYNAYAGTLTSNTTISGNAYVAGNLTVNSGVTLTVASGATLNFLSGSSLTVDGNLVSNVTLTIPSGITMTVNPGGKITFPSANIRLAVNGALSAAGTAANPATIDFTAPYVYGMNGIQFNSGSSGSFSYCTIKNGSYGIYAASAYVSVDHSTISNCLQAGICTNGLLPGITNSVFTGNSLAISISNAGVVSAPTVALNTVTNNTNGIYLYNSSPMHLENNTICNNTGYGIFCYHGSTPYMRSNTIYGNSTDGIHAEDNSPAHCGSYYGDPGLNVIRQNGRYGVYGWSSNVYLGSTAEHYGMNSIYSNGSYEVWAGNNSSILAQYNWWNVSSFPYFPSGDLHSESGASINPYPALSYNPNPGRQSIEASMPTVYSSQIAAAPEVSNAGPGFVSIDTTLFDSEIIAAINKLTAGKPKEAMLLFALKFNKEKNAHKRLHALEELAECYRATDTTFEGRVSSAEAFIRYLEKEIRPHLAKSDELYEKVLELKSIFYLDAGQEQRGVEALIEIRDNSTDAVIRKHALFNLAYICQNLLGEYEKGRNYLADLKNGYPDDELTQLAGTVLSNVGEGIDAGAAMKWDQTATADSTETDVQLGNYPNPFNPTTIITYQLPKSGQVTLKIYDVLGREVITLANENQNDGMHSVSFDASRLASGVYFYRLTAPGVNQVRKMLLTK